GAQSFQHALACNQLDLVALAVGEPDRLDMLVTGQRPRKARRRILTTRAQTQRRHDLAAPAVEWSERQLREIYALEAADIDPNTVITVGPPAAGKGGNAAPVAEQMMNGLRVELIVGESFFSREQLKLIRWNEVP